MHLFKLCVDDHHRPSFALQCCLFVVLMAFTSAFPEKRSGFVGMRGKKESNLLRPPYGDLYEYSENQVDYDQQPEIQDVPKRSGFVGMRGKKSPELENPEFYYEKRAGFLGMRGKKDHQLQLHPVVYYKPGFWYDHALTRTSRAGSSGFVGMRG